MIVPGCQLLTARYSNNERTVVIAELMDTETDRKIETTIICDDSDVQWKALLEEISLEELDENTFKYIRSGQMEIRRIAFDIAKQNGWLLNDVNFEDDVVYRNQDKKPGEVVEELEEKESVSSTELLLSSIFAQEPNPEHLFNLKMTMFNLPFVALVKDREKKAELRKATTAPDAMMALIGIWNQYLASNDDSGSSEQQDEAQS